MKYIDNIYGDFEIDEPVVLEIINSDFFQRLKSISQAGYKYENLFPIGTVVQGNRFEHSIGCYLLVKKFGANIEERIAALIHDLSHTVFSHCIDYALSNHPEKHDFQDNALIEYVNKTELPNILKKYNIDLDYILDENNFKLQENKLPDLCADRLDYSLRDFARYVHIDIKKIKDYVDNLTIINNQFVFKNKESAVGFAYDFMELNKTYYSGGQTAVMFFADSNYIKHALDKKYIDYDDLFSGEDEVIEVINKNLEIDSELKFFWGQMNAGFEKFSFDKNNYDREIICKSRAVNPLFLENGELKRVCDVDKNYELLFSIENKPKTYYVKYNK